MASLTTNGEHVALTTDTYNKADAVRFMPHCDFSHPPKKDREMSPEDHHQLQHDLLSTVYFTGNCCKDYLFFMFNWHPLLSMFVAHPQHPYSRCERIFTFLVGCSLTVLPTALLMRGVEEGHDASTEHLKEMGIFSSTTTESPLVIAVSHAINATLPLATQLLIAEVTAKPTSVAVASSGMVLLCVTLPVMIIEIILYQVAVLDSYCEDHEGHAHCLCELMAKLVKCIRNCCFCMSCCLSTFVLAISVMVMMYNEITFLEILEPWFTSRVQSWMIWPPLHLMLPCSGFLWRWTGEKAEHLLGIHSDDESDDEEKHE